MRFGYTLLGEQADPKQLVGDAARAEAAGFDFAVASDHYYPWLDEQGHSPYAWSVLGAVSQVTEQIELMSFVTCPIRRYHPVVVAQKAATMGLLSDGRFTLGVGAGENLNEHVVGEWPRTLPRHEMLTEALEIIGPLLDGQTVSHSGNHFEVPEARLWDRPEQGVPIAVAVSGPSSAQIAADYGDAMIATQPLPELGRLFAEAGGTGKPRYGQLPVCYAQDEESARELAHEQWRWGAFDWKVLAELPNPTAFDQATRFVRPEDVAEVVPCGPDLEKYVEAVHAWAAAGCTHLAFTQIGAALQDQFLTWAQRELLPVVRAKVGTD